MKILRLIRQLTSARVRLLVASEEHTESARAIQRAAERVAKGGSIQRQREAALAGLEALRKGAGT